MPTGVVLSFAPGPSGNLAQNVAAFFGQGSTEALAATIYFQGYENSTETTFVGKTVKKGYEPILQRYLTNYSNAAQMGTLTFTNLEVRILPSTCGAPEYAVVTGNFHLDRKEKGAATNDDGIFSLLWHKGPQGWKIVLDHTS